MIPLTIYMKKRYLLLFAAFLSSRAIAQDALMGIINHYAAVEAIDYCNNTLTVSDTAGFAPGQALLLIQMQGAEINTDNASSFGNVTALGSAGLYERARILEVNGLAIKLEKALINTYDLAGAVQAASMPAYEQAVVTSTLTAKSWDGSTGGVLAFSATQLTLQADIDLSGKGFRGGSAAIDYTGDCNFLSNYSNYAYDDSSIRGGRKGEGISIAPASRNRGRGAQANGGGGGNDHNAGGGGGGNVNAGGPGGENDNPSFFGCKGFYPGIGGKPLLAQPERLFMGGGGGAGHGNNDVATDGGNGGGIILIEWESVFSQGGAIRSNGLSALESDGDGGGGGGAGGTIAIKGIIPDFPGIQLEARGGAGGNADNTNTAQCFGPGGGGAGGRVLLSTGSMAFPNLNGGQSGLSINSTECGTGANGALAGANGSQGVFEGIPEGSEANTPPAVQVATTNIVACQGAAVELAAEAVGFGLSLQWQVDMGSGYENIQPGLLYGPADSSVLAISTVNADMAGYTYRLAVQSDCFPALFSPAVSIEVVPSPIAAFSFSTNGFDVQFDNLSTGADSYYWSFGDGGSSSAGSPLHTYAAGGNYTATLYAISGACGDSSAQSMVISLQAPPVAGFQASPASGCAPVSVTFNNLSVVGESYQWAFPGGMPSTSTAASPTVAYTQAGTYDAMLIATNSAGADTSFQAGIVTVTPMPQSAFTASVNGLSASFNNLSQNATTYFWLFGDGWNSMMAEPPHTYAASGVYTVQLIARNACGADTSSMELAVGAPPVPTFTTTTSSTGCAPATVSFANGSAGVYDSLLWAFPGGTPPSSTAENPMVAYAIPGVYDVQLTLFSPFGPQVLAQPQFVTVYARPEPAFDLEIDGLTVTFTNMSSGATGYVWNFGDGQSSQEADPVHTYSAPGAYNVTLNASNGPCSKAIGQTVVIPSTQAGEVALPEGVRLFPNPVYATLYLQCDRPEWYPVQWRLMTPEGRVLLQGSATGDSQWEMGSLPGGLYLLSLSNGEGRWTAKVAKP